MDKKVYERTRYQNIYRHKKNKNYVIMLSKPVKTSISKIDDKKIYDINIAIKVRDKHKNSPTNIYKSGFSNNFDELWSKYMVYCENIAKQAYNTLDHKRRDYNAYLKNKINKPLSRISKNELALFINNLYTTDKQKNQVIKQLNAFFSWCITEGYLNYNPLHGIKRYKVEKTKMKFWTPQEIKKFLETVEQDITEGDKRKKELAMRTKIFTILTFILGDRPGETRALTFKDFHPENGLIDIYHSINYDRKSTDFLSSTKNYQSQRNINGTKKIFDVISNYKHFLEVDMEYQVDDYKPIFFNYSTMKPFTDTALRKQFYNYCDKAEIKRIRLYDLRHTHVATMMSEGIELYLISERLGHSDFSTTINKYGHLSNETRKEVAKITDKYF